jgi:hypothetical protein
LKTEASIELTADEVMLLCDRIHGEDVGTPDQRVVSYRLLAKLGSVFLELVQDDHKEPGTVEVVLSEPELWWCRDKTSAHDRTADNPLLGVKLTRKLFAAILSLEDPPLPEPIEHTEPDRATVAHGFQRWLSDQSARYYGGPPL